MVKRTEGQSGDNGLDLFARGLATPRTDRNGVTKDRSASVPESRRNEL